MTDSNDNAMPEALCLVVSNNDPLRQLLTPILDGLKITHLDVDPLHFQNTDHTDIGVVDCRGLATNTLDTIIDGFPPGSRLLMIAPTIDQVSGSVLGCDHMLEFLATPGDPKTLKRRLMALTQTDILYNMVGKEKSRAKALGTEVESLKHTNAFLEEKVLFLDKQRERLGTMMEKSNMITEISHKINSLDFEDIVKVCIHKIPFVLGARAASLYLYDQAGNELVLKDHSNDRDIAKVIPLDNQPDSLMAVAITRRWPVIIQDFASFRSSQDVDLDNKFKTEYETETCIVAPLMVGEQIIGVLNLSDKKDGTVFDEVNDLPPIIQLSSQVAAAIHNYQLFQEVQTQARSDSMTGFLNHRAFYEELEAAISAAKRYDHVFSLVMIDIDSFKQFNDKHGHQVGDEVIRHVSRTIRASVRDTDVISRYGGDEFSIILKQADLAEARVVAERIRSAVVKTEVRTPSGVALNITLSVGIAEFDTEMTLHDFMRLADQMMYRAKALGKNRVEEMAG